MRPSVSFLFALLLVVTPIAQVHGQTLQQGASTPDASAVVPSLAVDARPLGVLEPVWVPWAPTLEADSSQFGATEPLPGLQPPPISTAGTIGIVAGAVVVLAAVIFVIACNGLSCFGD
jgi:hypothetical protein